MGIPVAMVEAKKREILARQANKSERDKIAATIDSTVNQVNGKNRLFSSFLNIFLIYRGLKNTFEKNISTLFLLRLFWNNSRFPGKNYV